MFAACSLSTTLPDPPLPAAASLAIFLPVPEPPPLFAAAFTVPEDGPPDPQGLPAPAVGAVP